MQKKYYEISLEDLEAIRAKLPESVKYSFGFESYGKHFFSSSTVDFIDSNHGAVLDLIIEFLFGQTKEDFLSEKESIAYEQYIDSKQRAVEGFDGYEKMMGNILSLGGLNESVDVSIDIYATHLTTIRMLLKDGLFTMCLRYFYLNIKNKSIIPNEDFAEDVIVQLCMKWGVSDQVIQAIKLTPKGSI